MGEISLALNDLFANGRYSEVVELCGKHSIDPINHPYAAHILSASLFNLGKHSEAQDILMALECSFGSNSDFLSLYAANSRRLGDLGKAKDLFLQALKLDPDNLLVKNNYANLLIDQESYLDAKNILESILSIQPGYSDAQQNLKRVLNILSVLNSSTHSLVPNISSASSQSNILDDPLMMAFQQDEITFSNERYLHRFKDSNKKNNFSQLPHSSPSKVLLEQIEAIRLSLNNQNPSLALKLCSKVIHHTPDNASIYEYASDAYLQLEKFHQSEICLLRSLMLGGASLKHYFNMITFSRMRKDYGQARFYFMKACAVDPGSPNLAQIKSLLDKESVEKKNFSFLEEWSIAD